MFLFPLFPGPKFLLVCHGLYAIYMTCPSNSSRSDHRNFVWWKVVCTSRSFSLCNFLHLPVTSLCTLLCSVPLNPHSSLIVTTDQVLHPEEATNKIIRFPVFVAVKTTYVFSRFWHRIVWWMLIIFQKIILSPVEGTSDWMHMLVCSRVEYEHTTRGGEKNHLTSMFNVASNVKWLPGHLAFYHHSRLGSVLLSNTLLFSTTHCSLWGLLCDLG
jgi:hypothetical protein